MNIEERFFNSAIWLTPALRAGASVAACVFMAIVTSCSPYVATVEPTPTPSQAATVEPSVNLPKVQPTPRPSCTVTGYLNFRTSPSRSAAVIRVLEDGDELTILSQKYGDWLKVQAHGRTGFVYGRYCR